MVPAVWIEHTTYRLQGGCSTAELSRHISDLLHLSGPYLSEYLSGRRPAIITRRRAARLGPLPPIRKLDHVLRRRGIGPPRHQAWQQLAIRSNIAQETAHL